ncbi:hypothetical protein [Streptomyces sp. NPDC051569]|uniref:hypothetical protein n=1 Tax=Streptomyces sp. NPDC051569 TaxID=3365661 RepID=UPI00378DCBCD
MPRTPGEAVHLVRRRFGQPTLPDDTPAPLHVHEFDLGYVVYGVLPRPTDQGGVPRPAQPGGSSFVVTKDSGDIATVPNYPPEQAAEVFRRHYRPGSRS